MTKKNIQPEWEAVSADESQRLGVYTADKNTSEVRSTRLQFAQDSKHRLVVAYPDTDNWFVALTDLDVDGGKPVKLTEDATLADAEAAIRSVLEPDGPETTVTAVP